MSFKKKDDIERHALHNLNKVTVIQDARIFNKTPISPKSCRQVLSKISFLTDNGEVLSLKEATELFFAITKLFQHKDPSLRQMVHVILKHLSSMAEDTLMITSSIMKDTSVASDVIYKPNAIRALCRVIDFSNVPVIERYLKASIVDRNTSVSSAALISSYHLIPIALEFVRKWASEVQEAALSQSIASEVGTTFYFTQLGYKTNPSGIAQYHAISLLYILRKNDKMALLKLARQLTKKSSFKHKYSDIMLLRIVGKLMTDDENLRQSMFYILESYLNHKFESVAIEAAKIILSLPNLSNEETTVVIPLLKSSLKATSIVTRFAAIRAIAKLAQLRPSLLSGSNLEIEQALSDSNRAIATYAVTALLKSGNESSVDSLMSRIKSLMEEVSDDFKVTIVDTIRSLGLKFPRKRLAMLKVLNQFLRNEGGFEFKDATVNVIFDLIRKIPEAKEEGIGELCEFIEDCDYSSLIVRILHLLGQEGPALPNPSKYIRYIYNRLVLEDAAVRAAAVNALSHFALDTDDPDIQKSVQFLLKRCLDDYDDEVRERTILHLRAIKEKHAEAKRVLLDSFTYNECFSLPVLESKLMIYIDSGEFDAEFDIKKIPMVSKNQMIEESTLAAQKRSDVLKQTESSAKNETAEEEPALLSVENQTKLFEISEFKDFGPIRKSSLQPTLLTEEEMEYLVFSNIHIFDQHIVVQYEVKNTLSDSILENVSMLTSPENDEIKEEFYLTCSRIGPNENGYIYVSYFRENAKGPFSCEIENTLKFTTREVDPATGEPDERQFDDEFQVDNTQIGPAAFINQQFLSNFDVSWENMDESVEASQTYALSHLKSLDDAVKYTCKQLSMAPIEGTDSVSGTSVHKMKLAGKLLDDTLVLALVQMVSSTKTGVTIKIIIRSKSTETSQLIADYF